MKFNNKLYDILKWVSIVALPAMQGLLFGLGKLWGWSWTENVCGTMALAATFIGALIGISCANYKNQNDGTLMIDKTGETDIYRLNIDELSELENKGYIKLKVDPNAKLDSIE